MRTRPTRREFAGGAAATLAASAAGPASAQAPVSGPLVLMTYAGIFQDLYTKAVLEPFMKANPGVKVQYVPGGTSAAMLGQLRAQKADPQIDVAILDAGVSFVGNAEGIFGTMTRADVPVIADLNPLAIVQDGFGPAVTFDNLVLVYDTTKVKSQPTSLAELWKPEWKGKIGIGGMPNIQGMALLVIVAKMLGEDHRTSIDKAIARLGELAPSVQTFDPQPDGYTMILNDALVWATGWNARAQYYHTQSNGRLGVMLPSEGSVLQINTINQVKGAKNSAAARAFVNYALSAEAQKSFTELMFYAPVNAKATISDTAMARTATARLGSMIPVDWAEMAKVRDAWNNRWKREIVAKSR